jgi:hypothetical protein
MAVTITRVQLWRSEVESRPGVLAGVLGALASAGANLQVAMAYRYPGNQTLGAIEVFPVRGKRLAAAAEAAGLKPMPLAVLRVEGDDRPGLGYATARAIADAGINVAFLVAQVVGRKYTSLIGFETDGDAVKAARLIKKAVGRATKR